MVEINEGVGRPQRLLNFLARHNLACPLKQKYQHLKRLADYLQPDTAFSQLTGFRVGLVNAETKNVWRWVCGLVLR